ncbi:MAG: hypothetical protein N0C88_12335 [Candidatus Thiodiazotropha lotti]|uniref:Uncharacterized protein n=1 Tax=Candidatus Thiodiazotropha lotti TaxID=2792787 RepID=A0A9E4N0W0_9GAMM|nr:hypothetical protein [Candidatus Thiodiazotropha lotti]MCG7939618.1 hypothetical protein [Candidatus Thiodiazotropha lotti]MCW4204091.1 hypothetical protein [Candidatus Thiodiazotropha lotti]MCW4222473.1 hypothetical protein [Candidatus Thiodiazotropha lotti]
MLMIEERLADIAQDSKPSVTWLADEVVGTLHQWLRKHGLANLGVLSDSVII